MWQGSQQVKVVFRDLGFRFLKVGYPVAGVDYGGVVTPPKSIAYIRKAKGGQFPGQRLLDDKNVEILHSTLK